MPDMHFAEVELEAVDGAGDAGAAAFADPHVVAIRRVVVGLFSVMVACAHPAAQFRNSSGLTWNECRFFMRDKDNQDEDRFICLACSSPCLPGFESAIALNMFGQ
jgi:hypothetical protein